MNLNEKIGQAEKLFSAGRFAEAEEACAQAEGDGTDSRLLYIYGLASYQNGNPEKAAECFERAVALNPSDFDSLFNLGVVSWELKKFEKALSTYKTLLEKAPHYHKALANYAQALIKCGNFEEGIKMFDRALTADPKDYLAASLQLEFSCLNLPMKERPQACNKILFMPSLPDQYKYTASIYRAAAEWTFQNLPAMETSLLRAAQVPPQPDKPGYRNMRIYHSYLDRLAQYRHENAALYEGQGQTIHLAGDSHSLSYATLPVKDKYKIDAHLIMGTQARHIASFEPEPKRDALARYIQNLPQGAKLFCAFGEIDCRVNHGIIPWCTKTDDNIEAVTANIVRDYVAFTSTQAAARKIDLSFIAVPAPLQVTGDRRKVVKIFNMHLLRCALDRGHDYLDIYTPAADKDGYGIKDYYIDNHHLKPDAAQRFLQK